MYRIACKHGYILTDDAGNIAEGITCAPRIRPGAFSDSPAATTRTK